MASKVKKGLESANVASAKALAKAQIAVDKILWGSRAITNTPKPDDRTQTPEDKDKNAEKRPLEKIKTTAKNKINRILDRGLYQVLDDLLATDLCNVITYLYTSILTNPTRGTNDNRGDRREAPTKVERILYDIQDAALAVQSAIDTFTTYPDRLINKYIKGGGFDPISQDEAVRQTTDPTTATAATTATQPQTQGTQVNANIDGTKTKKFNLVKLVQEIQVSFSDVLSQKDIQGQVIYEPGDKELLTAVPELQGILNFMNDILLSFNTYTDYRNITDIDLKKAEQQLNKLRAICVLIQSLSIKDTTKLLNLVPPTAIQKQLRNLNEVVDLTNLLPLIKSVNNAVQSFTGTAQRIQGVITKGQTIIRIAIVLIKSLKLITSFLNLLMVVIPSIFTTVGVGVKITRQLTKLDNIIDDLVDILKQVNQLLGLAISTVRYLEKNAKSLNDRLDPLVLALSNCPATKDSEILKQLVQATGGVKDLQTTLQTILNNYDGRTTPRKATFGRYTIEVIDEEVVDEGIVNRRRRGIALDNNGVFVLQSDLTFATDLAIIIQEVKIKLVAAGLVQPGLGSIDPNITIITESLSFLEENDLIAEDLNVGLDGADAGGALGLSSFIDDLNGGKQLRKRSRAKAEAVKSRFKDAAAIGNNTLTTVYRPQGNQPAPAGSLSKYEVQIYENGVIKRIYNTTAASVNDAIKQAMNTIDPNRYYPNWKYVARRVG